MKKFWLTLLIGLVPSALLAQGVNVLPRYIIDYPIAYSLPRASFDVTMRVFPQGGALTSIDVGMNDRLMFGVSFGGINIIGEGDIVWQPFAGANFRYRLLTETFTMPALAVGFDSQGHGAYNDEAGRFERKSTGFFIVASKNYDVMTRLSFHVGTNYSLETADGDRSINLFTGADLGITPELSVLGEYDFALNDNADNSLGSGKGYLNLGLRYNIKNVVYFEVYLIDLLRNKYERFRRAVKLTYFEFF
ncbi:MAG: hypothetical protein Q9P14_08460 [candidate division KSB1 bacterium]|nr:hypothetical protein [candidate division KSB1 bacterium]MDQ7065786.1 hypothetical protein [candidate division KSB1 bacterium]